MNNNGWIKLHRKIADNPFWSIKPFSKGQAMVDLILLANHTDKKIMFRDSVYYVKRGQILTSELQLGKRWGWSRTKIKNYLKLLQNEDFLIEKSDNRKSIITIVNYDTYQNTETTDNTTGNTTGDTTEKQQKSTNKNIKNDKNIRRKTIKKKNLSDFAYKIADEFHDYQMKNCPVASIKNWDREKWVDVIDKLMRIDGYKQQTISDALSFAVNDDFWKKQIISLAGLRKKGKNGLTKFDNLVIRMEEKR